MKRFILVLLLLIPAILPAGVDQRIEWWTMYHENLLRKAEKIKPEGDATNRLLETIRRDTEKAGEFIRELSSVSALRSSSREGKATLENVIPLLDSVTVPMINMAYLDLLVNGIGDTDNIAIARNSVRKVITVIAAGNGISEADDIESVMNSFITPDDWKQLSAELFAGSMIISRERVVQEIRSSVAQSVRDYIGKKNNTMSLDEAETMIVRETEKNIDGGAMIGLLGSFDEALSRSPFWNRMSVNLKTRFGHYAKIKKISGTDSLKLDQYLRSGGSLYLIDSMITGGRKAALLANFSSTAANRKRQFSVPSLPIPAAVNHEKVLEGIDSLRKKYLRAGHVQLPVSAEEARRSLDSLVDESYEKSGKEFQSGLVRLKDGKISYSNEAEFMEAFRGMERGKSAARSFGHFSAELIEMAVEGKELAKEDILGINGIALQRGKEYLNFIVDLYRFAAPCSTMVHPVLHGKYDRNTRKIAAVMQILSSGIILTKAEQRGMDRETLLRFQEMKGELSAEFVSVNGAVKNYHKKYFVQYGRTKQQAAVTAGAVTENIASREIETLLDSSQRYAGLHDSCAYDETILAQYVTVFAALYAAAAKGNVSGDLDRVIKEGSLFGIIGSFDLNRLKDEVRVREIARQEALTGLERISWLKNYYQRQNTGIGWSAVADDVHAVRKRFTRHPSVMIDEWRMNALNIAAVDRNAALKLKKILALALARKKDGGVGEKITIAWNNCAISHILPEGWKKIDERNGGVRNSHEVTYSDLSNSIRITIKISVDEQAGLGIDEIYFGMLTAGGGRQVKTRWGKLGETSYFWALGKNADDRVVEAYTLRRGSHIVVFQGTGDKMNYSRLQERLKQVVESLGI